MKCSNCSAEVGPDDVFCGACGTRIQRIQLEPVSTAVPATIPNRPTDVVGPTASLVTVGMPTSPRNLLSEVGANVGVARESEKAGLKLAGGIGAIIGAIAIVTACALPMYSASTLFNPSTSGERWFAVEPFVAGLIALAVGVFFVVASGKKWVLVTGGGAVALGLETTLFYVGYLGNGLSFTSADSYTVGAASLVGIIGGLSLLSAGILTVASAMSADGGPYVRSGPQEIVSGGV
jgi:hypothetical protein